RLRSFCASPVSYGATPHACCSAGPRHRALRAGGLGRGCRLGCSLCPGTRSMALAVGVPGAADTGVAPGHGSKAAAHLRPLTGLRFVAALLVVIHHYFGIATGDYGQRADPRVPNLIAAAFVGVNVFFILSGFILAYNYLGADGQLRVMRRDFWAAHFARIYPVYLLAFLVASLPSAHYLLSHHASPLSTTMTGLAALTLTQAWVPASSDAWNGPGWSLSAEA